MQLLAVFLPDCHRVFCCASRHFDGRAGQPIRVPKNGPLLWAMVGKKGSNHGNGSWYRSHFFYVASLIPSSREHAWLLRCRGKGCTQHGHARYESQVGVRTGGGLSTDARWGKARGACLPKTLEVLFTSPHGAREKWHRSAMPPRLLPPVRLASSLLSLRPKRFPSRTGSPWRLAAACLGLGQQRCASILSSLSDNAGAYHKKIRRGRGPASGKGKTGGRGQKGQHAHGKVPAGFEGGQTPQSITNPDRGRGKYQPFTVKMSPINLDRIQAWIDQGRLDASKPITIKELAKSRCLHGVKRHGVKLLASNCEQLTTPIHIVVSRASGKAIARVEAVGGSVTTRFYSPTSLKRVLRGDSHPVISLEAPAELVGLAAQKTGLVSSAVLSSLQRATTEADKKAAVAAAVSEVGQRYKYRLPDATGRKDMEYYRDASHRGYLAHRVKEGESASLFFKPAGEVKDRKKQRSRKHAAKASADNRLF